MAIVLRQSKGSPLTWPQGDNNFTWLESGSVISASVNTASGEVTLFRRSTSNTVTGAAGSPVASVTFIVPTGSSSIPVNVSTYLSSSWTGSTTSQFSGTSSFATTAKTASYVLNAQTASYVVLAQTASYVALAQTASFVTTAQTASYVALAQTASFYQETQTFQDVTTLGAVSTASIVATGSFTGSFAGTFAGTASYALQALTSSFANAIKTANNLGVTVNNTIDGVSITSSILTVNGVFPDVNRNVSTPLTAVITGDSGSFVQSQSLAPFTGSLTPGTIWVIAGTTGSSSGTNGNAYIYTTGSAGSGSWYELGSTDLAQYDARYLMLAGTNSPMQGNVNFGTFRITNLGPAQVSTDAINLGQLTASLLSYVLTSSFNAWTGSNTSYFFGTSSLAKTASFVLSSSYAVSASYLNGTEAVVETLTVNGNTILGDNPFADTLQVNTLSDFFGQTYFYNTVDLTSANAIGNLTGTASYATETLTSSFAQTASYVNITGSGVIVNYNGSQIQLTGSSASTDTLQTVTTRGASSTSSLLITGSLFGTATTASYVNLTGSGVVINYNGSQIQLTGSTTAVVSDTAPTGLADNSLWFNSTDTSLYVNYNDGNSTQWVGVTTAGTVTTASYALSSSYALTASFISGSISNAISSSYALTASYMQPVYLSAGRTGTRQTGIGSATDLIFNSQIAASGISFNTGTGVFTLTPGIYRIDCQARGYFTTSFGYFGYAVVDSANNAVNTLRAYSQNLDATINSVGPVLTVFLTVTSTASYKIRTTESNVADGQLDMAGSILSVQKIG